MRAAVLVMALGLLAGCDVERMGRTAASVASAASSSSAGVGGAGGSGGQGGAGGTVVLCAACDSPDVCVSGVCQPATCDVPACPLLPVDACPGLTKTYCCGPDGFAPVCTYGGGFVSEDCPAGCASPCSIGDAGTLCAVSLDGG